MRKWILITLKTQFHIALFRMKYVLKRISFGNSDQIALFQGRISVIPEVRGDLFLAISKTGMLLLTLSFLNVLLLWFPAGLKKLMLVLFFKVS